MVGQCFSEATIWGSYEATRSLHKSTMASVRGGVKEKRPRTPERCADSCSMAYRAAQALSCAPKRRDRKSFSKSTSTRTWQI